MRSGKTKRSRRGISLKLSMLLMFWAIVSFGVTGVISSATSLWVQSRSNNVDITDFSTSKNTLFDFSGIQFTQQNSMQKNDNRPAEVLYDTLPKEGDLIGTLEMVSINRTVKIIQGTSRTQLKKGAGHYINSALPGELDNSVISGHRETTFLGIGKLVIGDQLIVKTSAGTFVYHVIETRIVAEDDTSVIVPTDDATLTLTTCYPFNTPGYSPERYIVSAILFESE